jgi:hypothetical protein
MRAAGVLPALAPTAVLVHDFCSPYWAFDVLHAACGAHLWGSRDYAEPADCRVGFACVGGPRAAFCAERFRIITGR